MAGVHFGVNHHIANNYQAQHIESYKELKQLEVEEEQSSRVSGINDVFTMYWFNHWQWKLNHCIVAFHPMHIKLYFTA